MKRIWELSAISNENIICHLAPMACLTHCHTHSLKSLNQAAPMIAHGMCNRTCWEIWTEHWWQWLCCRQCLLTNCQEAFLSLFHYKCSFQKISRAQEMEGDKYYSVLDIRGREMVCAKSGSIAACKGVGGLNPTWKAVEGHLLASCTSLMNFSSWDGHKL